MPCDCYNVKSFNIRRVFPSVHCSTSIQRLFPIGNMRMLQVFLYHHQIYFLLLVLNLIFHHLLRSLIFHQDLNFSLDLHLLRTFNICHLQLKFTCFLWLCSMRSYSTSKHSVYNYYYFDKYYFAFLSLFKIFLQHEWHTDLLYKAI